MNRTASATKIAARWAVLQNRKYAGPLRDVTHLRHQAVFMMGAAGSGKTFVAHQWLKYMPGQGGGGASRDIWKDEKLLEETAKLERGWSNLNFEKAKDSLARKGIHIEPVKGGGAKIPFRLYTYDDRGAEQLVDPEDWAAQLPPAIYEEVQGLTDVIFNSPKHELPSFWRQVNPDVYKEELAGYLAEQPGYVHEMSSEMSKAYFEAAVETGDPLIVDGTGANLKKMAAQIALAKSYNYRVTLVFVWVPLTINQIRNATRARKVKASIVTQQWHKIEKNFNALRGQVDKAKFMENTFDSGDKKRWDKHRDFINDFIRKSYNGQFQGLKDLVAAEAPSELSRYGKWFT